ncbi:MAG: hypothetical protein WCI77_04545 [Candidatus Omnitrophota bacterium]
MEQQEEKLLGSTILGWINCFIFGLFFLLLSLSVYMKATPQDLVKVTEVLKARQVVFDITFRQFKIACLYYAFFSSIFFISGLGILLKKEWARKLTIYFALLIAILIFLSVLLVPGLISQAFLQIVYPGILLLYFTNKNVEARFKAARARAQ